MYLFHFQVLPALETLVKESFGSPYRVLVSTLFTISYSSGLRTSTAKTLKKR